MNNIPIHLKAILILGIVLLLSTPVVKAQQRLNGRIKDENGQFVQHVQLLTQDSIVLGQTNENGYFNIEVSSIPVRLLLKKENYQPQTLNISQSELIEITLHKTIRSIAEVNVFGYYRKNSGFNKAFDIVEIEGDKVINTFEPNIVNTLRGRVPGLQMTATAGGVTSGSGMVIRGLKSIAGGNQPLFVLDGIPIENETSGANQYGGQDWGNSLKELNAYDVETIEVLKSASSVNKYGSRGLNGVIEIVTKGARMEEGFSIETNIGGSQGESYRMPHLLDAATIGKINESRLAWLSSASQNYLNSFQTASSQVGHIALNYFKGKNRVRLSYTADYNKGTYPNNSLDKNNIMFKGIREWNSKFSTELGVIYNNSLSRNAPSIGAQSFASLGNVFMEYPLDFVGDMSNDPVENQTAWYLYGQLAQKRAQSVRAYLHSDWKLLPSLNFSFGGNFSDYGIRTSEHAFGYFEPMLGGEKLYHQEQAYRNYASEYMRDFMLKGGFYFNKEFAENTLSASLSYDYWQTDAGISGEAYRPLTSNPFTLTAGIGERSAIMRFMGDDNFARASSFDIRHANTKSIHGALLNIEYKYGHNLFLSAGQRFDHVATLGNLQGLGKLNLFYPTAGLVYFYGPLLRQWLNIPGEVLSAAKFRATVGRTGNVTGLFHYSSDVTNDMELPYPSHNTLYKPYYTNSGSWGFTNYQTGFSYENAVEMEFGTNLSLLRNRVDLSVTWYHRNIANHLYDIVSPLESYNIPLREVHASVINKGWEVQLRLVPVSSPAFSWSSTINFSANRNRISSINASGSDGLSLGASQNDVSLLATVNSSFGTMTSSYAAKLDAQGRPILNAALEYEPAGTPRVIGDATPNWLAGFENRFTYKNFNISALLDFKIGGDIYSGTYALLYQRGVLGNTAFGRSQELGGVERREVVNSYDSQGNVSGASVLSTYDGIIPEGVFDQNVVLYGTAVGGMTFLEAQQAIGRDGDGEYFLQPVRAADYYSGHHDRAGVREQSVFDNSYIAVREISIGYVFREQHAKCLGLKRLEIGGIGRNLGYIYTSLPYGLNPDGSYNNRNGGAFEYASLLPVRSIGVFLRANF